MKIKITIIIFILFPLLIYSKKLTDLETLFSNLDGDYLGQKYIGNDPEIFAPGILSHGFHELGITISSDNNEIFYVTADNRSLHYAIINVSRKNGKWESPKVASFSGSYSDYRPFLSPDGEKLIFSSIRNVSGENENKKDYDLWLIQKENNAWSKPKHLGNRINSKYSELNPSMSLKETIFFQAKYESDSSFEIYYSLLKEDKYLTPQKLNSNINTMYDEGGPYISPDESFLIFHSNRPNGFGKADLYISFKNKEGQWDTPINLGNKVNSSESETIPFLTFDGKYLFYTSFRTFNPSFYKNKSYKELLNLYNNPLNGNGTIFWIRTENITVLTNK